MMLRSAFSAIAALPSSLSQAAASRLSRPRVSAAASRAMGERVVCFLRKRHDRGKVAECVSADTGLPASTVNKWLEGASTPSGYAYVQLIRAYGATFLCATMDRPPAWLVTIARSEETARIDAQMADLARRRARV